MEAAAYSAVHDVEGVHIDGTGLEAPPPPLHLPSSSSTSSSHSPLPSHHFLHASSSSNLDRQMECWICFDTRTSRANPIVTHRCRCRGSVGFVHQKCIDRWVIQQHNRACQSCGAVYRLVHSDYPPNAYLPLDPEGRRAFLFQFFVKPLLKEVAETCACVLLRFFCVPFIIGMIYNHHRAMVLRWIIDGNTKWPFGLSANPVGSRFLLWLFNADIIAASSIEVNYTICLSAWADTLLFGLLLCTVMNAVSAASRKWKNYFRNARREHQQEEARQTQAAAAAVVASATAEMGGVGNDDLHAHDAEQGEERNNTAQMAVLLAGLQLPPLPPAQPFVAELPIEGWRPEWGPVPVDTDFEPDNRAEAPHRDNKDDREDYDAEGEGEDEEREEDDDATTSDNDGSFSDDSGDDDDDTDSDDADGANSDDHAPARLSFVDEIFDTVEWVKRSAGGGGLHRLLPSLTTRLQYGIILALLLRCPLGRILLGLACVMLIIGWRFLYSRNVLASPKRRFEEVAKRIPLLRRDEVQTLFYVYLVDAFIFYCILPVMGGIMLHYALSPYLDIGMNSGLLGFCYGLTVWKLLVYWAVGALLVMLLTAVELTVVSVLFANGVELFFVRSFDSRWDQVFGYWRCVITQVFDADPLRIVCGFVRVAVVELLVLLIFVRLPFWGMFAVRDLIWGDGLSFVVPPLPASSSSSSLLKLEPTKLEFNMGIYGGYNNDQKFTFAEWRRAEALKLLDEKVLIPFGEFYMAMIGLHPSFVKGGNFTAPVGVGPLVAAATVVTSATPAQMWSQVWGNMTDHAVFTLDLIDPAAAEIVAELSEGFRDTLNRVRAPLSWLRQATLRGSVCDTLTALSSPADLSNPQDALKRQPAVDLESLLKPPDVVLPLPNATAARNRQMIFEAWQRAHLNALRNIQLVAPTGFDGGVSGQRGDGEQHSSREHTVNIVNCYVTLLQLTQPFVRVGRWQTAVMEWWSMQLISNVYVDYGAIFILYVYAFFIAVACFGVFPLQRAQLRLLLPFVQWVGRRVVHMEEYLFDPEQTRAVEDFVHAELDDELVLPPMVEPLGFNRREDYIDDSLIPRHVVLRRVVMSVLFFAASSLMVWTVPVLCGSLLLSFTCNAIPVLLGATLMSFFIWSPSLMARAAMLGGILTLACFFALPLLFTVYVVPALQTFWKCYPTLVLETFQRHYNIRQMVGPLNERDMDWYDKSNDSGGWRRGDGAAVANDEWESVESSATNESEGSRELQEPPETRGEGENPLKEREAVEEDSHRSNNNPAPGAR